MLTMSESNKFTQQVSRYFAAMNATAFQSASVDTNFTN